MEGTTKIIETPHRTSVRGSHDSVDSGYSTINSYTEAVFTPLSSTGCRASISSISGKRHRTRLDPLRSERALRHRSKLNQLLLNSSESAESRKDAQLNFSDDHGYAASPSFDLDETQDLEYGFRGRTHRAWRSSSITTAVTPASTRLPIMMSSPLSPAVPCSSFIASEPIEEDVEMKLVIVPQSTPRITSSSRLVTTPPRIVARSDLKSSPAIKSEENRKLSKLTIGEPEIKPKRLDFSHRALSVSFRHTRATPDYTGRETVDVLAALGEKSNHWRIVSKILAYLGPQDLCAFSMVSKTWKRLCINDSKANARRLTHVILRQNVKENLKIIKKTKMEADLQSSPRSRYSRKGYLVEVQNLLQVPAKQQPPNSPPVSPSKFKFHSFVRASRTLAPWEHLLPCPKCSFPCHVNGEKNVGTCSRQGCSMEFCTSCSSEAHSGPCKTPLLATPTKRNKRILIVGSRQSKRNLRRL